MGNFPKPPAFNLTMGVSKAKTGLLAAAFVLGMWPPPPAAHAQRKMNKPNHLIKEKSPYLLQHAYNPVEWFPWGEAAFKKAREENKPILLSIGYSTCHWCHVMERESFSDPKLAALLKKYFVSIKVDREERPDIDKIYMTAITAMTGSGGWPLNVFLAPDLKPFYGGTYFPPKPAYGRPSFSMVLERIAEDWKTHRKELLADASRMAQLLRQHAGVPGSSSEKDPAWLDGAYRSYAAGFDPKRGGFGGSPKFPMPSTYDFLLRYHSRSGKAKALEMVTTTLREMAKGGIYDHVGGGFHRYATDAEWRVPHFEKMLYDNAQLAATYLDAYQATRNPEFARVARETLEYVLRDMTHGRGGFFSAEDADSLPPELAAKGYSNEGHEHKSEGAFYLWTEKELKDILGGDSALFIHRYGVHGGGNAPADPHGEFTGKNILYAEYTLEETAKKFGLTVRDAEMRLQKAKETLLGVRAGRPRPALDDKILTSWNGLMISAFAKGAQILGDARYLEAAERAASFIRAELYDQKTRHLYHRFRAGSRAIPGLANDYAFLVQGLLDLYEAGFDPDWLDWAVELTETQQRLFAGGSGGLYMTSEGHDSNLIARVMEDSDGVEPAPSSVAALNLLRLANLTGREDFERDAEKTLEGFGTLMRERPTSLPKMLVALDFSTAKPRQIILAGDPRSKDMQVMLEVIHERFMPVKILLMVQDGPRKDKMSGSLPFLKGIKPIKGKATAYVCHDYTCKLPTNDPKVLEKILAGEN